MVQAVQICIVLIVDGMVINLNSNNTKFIYIDDRVHEYYYKIKKLVYYYLLTSMIK